jgi:hypothetical protein
MLVLLGPRLAQHDRIDDLQVGRVRRQRQMDIVVVELAVGRSAEMVFHVARTLHIVGHERAALELVEDGAPVRLGHHVGQDVQPAHGGPCR